MKTKDIASFAAGLAAGSYTHDEVLKLLGGDKSLMKEVVGMAAGFGVGSIASSVTSRTIENVPILKETCEAIDEAVGGLFSW